MRRRDLLKGAGALVAALVLGAGVSRARDRREVLAFHYGWYGAEEGWGSSMDGGRNHPNRPQGGLYDSLDLAVIRRQLTQASSAGVTGFITSWDSPGDRRDRVLDGLLAAAPGGFSISPYLEVSGGSVEALVQRLTRLYDRSLGARAWLRRDGRPVVFVFDRVLQEIGLEGWAAAVEGLRDARGAAFFAIGTANSLDEIEARSGLFDALHVYSLTFVTEKWPWPVFGLLARRWMRRWVEAQAGLRLTTATVLPAFDDRRLDDRMGRRPVTPRRQGRTYRALWEAALAARPDWVLIVSWNEWMEASEIEPSLENGRREIETTRAMSRTFMG